MATAWDADIGMDMLAVWCCVLFLLVGLDSCIECIDLWNRYRYAVVG